MNSFSKFEILKSLLKTLSDQRITKPTEIQSNIIPMMMEKKSVVGIAETGSGKTLAYVLPILHLLKSLEHEGEAVTEARSPRAIVMVPTRDLGEQISKVFKTLTHDTRLRVRPGLGGMELETVRRNIAGPFEVLLATPGRLVQLMQRKLIKLTDVRMLIFDEADQMLDEGFLSDSKLIVEACPTDVQLGMFSATVSDPIEQLISTLFSKAEVYRSAASGKVVSTLTTKNIPVHDGQRWPLFEKLLKDKTEGGTLVFVNTRDQCDALANELVEKGYPCTVYRGEMDKVERRNNLKKFRSGEISFLISTDLASRGLDIDHIDRVINYHLPQELENYLHRAGRTARAGRKGTMINLVTERDLPLMDELGLKVPLKVPQKQNPPASKEPAFKKRSSFSKSVSPVKFKRKKKS